MSKQPLSPDEKSAEIWRSLPQSQPTKDALPPLFGGGSLFRAWWFWLFALFGLFALISLIAGRI